jgi:hypothetical protein
LAAVHELLGMTYGRAGQAGDVTSRCRSIVATFSDPNRPHPRRAGRT